MRKNLDRKYIVILIILLLCSLPCISIATTIIEELEQNKNEITIQMQETEEQIEEVQIELSGVMKELQNINEKISQYELEIQELSLRTDDLRDSIEKLEERLSISEASYNEQKQMIEERMVTVYEAGETTYLDVLLSSRSLSEFISNYYLVTEIIKFDVQILEDVERESRAIQANKKELERQREQLKSARNNRERTAIVLENTKVIRNNYMSKLSGEEQKLQEAYDEYEQLIREIESEILMLALANLDSEYNGGIMAWPTPGYTRITSPFGMRVHPIDGLYKMHTGVDIAAPTGTPFIAVSDGIVVKAGWQGAYGNMVMVDHGGGVSTVYGHGTDILVTLGQEVKRGEPVMTIGSTGYSTGPHAHFEVRINGKTVDPLNYIMKNNPYAEKQETEE